MSLPRLTLFDLDHTLLDGDSDLLWGKFLVGLGELDHERFDARNRELQIGYREGTVGAAAFSAFYIGTLRGRTAQAWAPLRARFLDEVIAPRLPPASHQLVRDHREAGDLVVLSTATNRFLSELTAAHLGIDHLIATDCAFDSQQQFTGEPLGVLNMREGKLTRLHAWLAARGSHLAAWQSRFYSDSINDLPLLLAVDQPVTVDPDSRLAAHAAQSGWPVMRLHPPRKKS